MPNKNYLKGRRLEYEVRKAFKDAGCFAWRSAGSHGPFDVQVYGSTSQCDNGWIVLRNAGFSFDPLGNLTRRSDTLYWLEFISQDGSGARCILIQCKRLPSTKGKVYGKNK